MLDAMGLNEYLVLVKLTPGEKVLISEADLKNESFRELEEWAKKVFCTGSLLNLGNVSSRQEPVSIVRRDGHLRCVSGWSGSSVLLRYFLFEAADLETVVSFCRECPVLSEHGGSVEIYPIMEFPASAGLHVRSLVSTEAAGLQQSRE